MVVKETIGLSSAEALKQLHDEISEVLKIHENKDEKKIVFKNANQNEILPKYSLFITVLVIIGLIFKAFYITAFFVLLILILNVVFVLREEKLKRTELARKTRLILSEIQLAVTLSKDWKTNNYPHLCSPLSPCISLMWTYRDGEIVNLPTTLLVEGDIIVMRLGSTAAGNCHEVQSKSLKPKTFKAGDTYGLNSQKSEPPQRPIAVQPLPDILCVMDHTPFIDNLKLSLEKFLERPPTIHDRQRHILINNYMQRYIFFLTILVILFTLSLRKLGKSIEGKLSYTEWVEWVEIGVLNCVSAWVSLLPLIFPLIWVNLHHWGAARLETLLSIPQPLMQVRKVKSSPEMIDTPTSGDLDLPIIPRKQVWINYLRLLNGSCELLSRSTNIIQVLGSISAFCCVDKKGILSWPNPTPEKVFFLRDSTEGSSKSSSDSSLNSDLSDQNGGIGVTAEVLDVTHDQNSPFKLEFDDHEWKNHLSSLKPLGEFSGLIGV